MLPTKCVLVLVVVTLLAPYGVAGEGSDPCAQFSSCGECEHRQCTWCTVGESSLGTCLNATEAPCDGTALDGPWECPEYQCAARYLMFSTYACDVFACTIILVVLCLAIIGWRMAFSRPVIPPVQLPCKWSSYCIRCGAAERTPAETGQRRDMCRRCQLQLWQNMLLGWFLLAATSVFPILQMDLPDVAVAGGCLAIAVLLFGAWVIMMAFRARSAATGKPQVGESYVALEEDVSSPDWDGDELQHMSSATPHVEIPERVSAVIKSSLPEDEQILWAAAPAWSQIIALSRPCVSSVYVLLPMQIMLSAAFLSALYPIDVAFSPNMTMFWVVAMVAGSFAIAVVHLSIRNVGMLRCCQVITTKRVLLARVALSGDWIITSHPHWMKLSYEFVFSQSSSSGVADGGAMVLQDESPLNPVILLVDDSDLLKRVMERVGYEGTIPTPCEGRPVSLAVKMVCLTPLFLSIAVVPGIIMTILYSESVLWEEMIMLSIAAVSCVPLTWGLYVSFKLAAKYTYGPKLLFRAAPDCEAEQGSDSE